jgi:hypothetical protein
VLLPEPKSMTRFVYHAIFCDVIAGCWRANPFERKTAQVGKKHFFVSKKTIPNRGPVL